ncbi:MAG: hypothetical protein EXR71_14440 [Myxococcales bacterium]|nr:hypothetical protein [Myxococcales bacterium]
MRYRSRRALSPFGQRGVNNPTDAPADCKYHGSLGSGWDFSESPGPTRGWPSTTAHNGLPRTPW